ncbi:MAG: RDD family protein [Solirubrobacteraceae bacterium]
MEYEDRIAIPTPEGIELDYTLAGVGSRFIAELVDVSLRLVVLAVLVGVLAAIGAGTWGLVVLALAAFAAWFVYDVVFEVWGAGRTPGKRWSGLRVVTTAGGPVSLGASAVRTLLRLIDVWLTLGVVGTVSIISTRRNQRVGDLAATTIVIRERQSPAKRSEHARGAGRGDDEAVRGLPAPSRYVTETAAGLDVTGVSAGEVAAIRDFLTRRRSLSEASRERVAQALADRLGPKVGGLPPGGLQSEFLLEAIAAAKDGAGTAED